MDKGVSAFEGIDAQGNEAVAGDHSSPRRKAAGRKPKPCIDQQLTAQAAAGTLRNIFPGLQQRLDGLPDPRRREMCRYSSGHVWFSGVLMFLTRAGSRNAFDQTRNSGQAPENMGAFCGQGADDPRFDGEAMITCTDNLVHHLARVDASHAEPIPVELCDQLIKRRMFDNARLFGSWYILVFDGTVQEKCRKGFEEGGKRVGSKGARYRYVLQCGLLGPADKFFPFMHEHIDMHNPHTEKEDCELNAFFRLAQRVKKRYPRMPFCIVGDALFLTEGVAQRCSQYGWKYVLTTKEGRQPGLWEELLALLPLHPQNRLRVWKAQDGKDGLRDFRWVENLPLGSQTVTVVLSGEMPTGGEAVLYAYATNLMINKDRVCEAISASGRERHLVEDYFNAAKNNGIGLGHVFCANDNVSKNLFSLLQVAAILWTIICHGFLRRVFQWAARATDIALARALAEGMRSGAFPPTLPQPGQLRFVT
jgi:hypothetical protein